MRDEIFFLSFPRPPEADRPSAEKRESRSGTRNGLDVRIESDNDKGKAFDFYDEKCTVGFYIFYVWVLWIPACAGMTTGEQTHKS